MREDATVGWTSAELKAIGGADELQLAPSKDSTAQKPVTIWVVCVDSGVYVRAYRGSKSAWFRRMQLRHEGWISAGGVTEGVRLVGVGGDDALNDLIDAAYRSKYAKYGPTYVNPMTAQPVRVTTMKLVPYQRGEGDR